MKMYRLSCSPEIIYRCWWVVGHALILGQNVISVSVGGSICEDGEPLASGIVF